MLLMVWAVPLLLNGAGLLLPLILWFAFVLMLVLVSVILFEVGLYASKVRAASDGFFKIECGLKIYSLLKVLLELL